MIYFIIGASGSGKTACLQGLSKALPDLDIHDFDDIGVPEDVDTKWRQQTTESWIKQLSEKDIDSVLLGQMVPGEIIACPSAKQLSEIVIILLDCCDTVRIQRLKQRGGYCINQDTLNWAAWLRMHCVDPQWEQVVIKRDSAPTLEFDRWNKLTVWPDYVRLNTLDTSNLNIFETVLQLKHMIDPQRSSVCIGGDVVIFSQANIADLDSVVRLLKDDSIALYRESNIDDGLADYVFAFEQINRDPDAASSKNNRW